MSHLLAISVGPVQEFIAAARRTRDLWFGSYLLSEISRAVAKCVKVQEDTLIFPALVDAENVANVILAELRSGDPEKVAAAAKGAANDCWKTFAEKARIEAASIIREEVWNDQVDDVIEFYAAWVQATGNYTEDRKMLMSLLAGRKACRDFLPPKGRAGFPKSSLDGQRETVLKSGGRTDWPQNLRLSQGEQLDVVGVTKRLGKKQGENNPAYPSVARVAAETWLRAESKHPKFAALNDACGKVPGLHKVREKAYQYFPWEGTVIFKDRHPDLVDELGAKARQPLNKVAALLKEIGGEPNPYLAVLVADGDKIGAVISSLASAESHRDFSTDLNRFAAEACGIVNNYNGVLVYAGGDDVLAFLPVDKCLGCARDLHGRFGDLLKTYKSANGDMPTLSVGVAIGHFMENLEDLLDYGRAAEQSAKAVEGKDALAIHLHKRGGVPISVRAKWRDNPDTRLSRYASLLIAGAIPAKLPYDLRNLANLYQDWPAETAQPALRIDVLRIIRDKQPLSGRASTPEIESILQNITSADGVRQFALELLLARAIAGVTSPAANDQVQVKEPIS